MYTPRKGRGRGRGVLGLTSLEPCPRPGASKTSEQQSSKHSPVSKPVNVVKPLQVSPTKQKLKKLIAKYSYTSNPAQPGGFKELTIKPGEKLNLVQKGHKETNNPLWWEVMNENGEAGFVPHNYCMEIEEKLSALPWLETKKLEEEKERKENEKIGFGAPVQNEQTKPSVKPYMSAYTGNGTTTKIAPNAAMAAKQYYCKVCDKNLNGPQPYKMHMSSKAHREEMEYRGLKDDDW